MVCPIIDVIDDDSFAYIAGSDSTWGGFNWRLNFRWYAVPQREMDRRRGDRTVPLRCVHIIYTDYDDGVFASTLYYVYACVVVWLLSNTLMFT